MDVPVVDLARTDVSDLARARAAVTIDEALSQVGFMTVVHHGIHPRLVARTFDAARTFFDQPLPAKEAVAGDRGQPHGYGRLGNESQAYANGERTLPDLSETFSVHPGVGRYPEPNRWPADIVGFQDTFGAYLQATAALADRVMGLCALALGLDHDHFVPHLHRASLTLRANHYPALREPPAPQQYRGGAHTDYGSITLLATDGVPGLEIRDGAGAWHPVCAPRGSLLVNVGDLLARWTNDRWRSTWHRVVPPPGPPPYPRRLSLVLFQTPNDDAVIEALPSCVSADNPPRYEPVTAGRFLRDKLDALYSVQSQPAS